MYVFAKKNRYGSNCPFLLLFLFNPYLFLPIPSFFLSFFFPFPFCYLLCLFSSFHVLFLPDSYPLPFLFCCFSFPIFDKTMNSHEPTPQKRYIYIYICIHRFFSGNLVETMSFDEGSYFCILTCAILS